MAIPRPHPGLFVGSLVGRPFAGFLPTAFMPGPHAMWYDESHFGLTAGLGAGATIPPGVPAPPVVVGSHDNIDAYNEWPFQVFDRNGDMFSDVNFFFSIAPDEAVLAGVSAADLFDVAAKPGTVPIPMRRPSRPHLRRPGQRLMSTRRSSGTTASRSARPGAVPAASRARLRPLQPRQRLAVPLRPPGHGRPGRRRDWSFSPTLPARSRSTVGAWTSGVRDIQTGDPFANIDAIEMFDCYADYNQDLQINTLDVLGYLNDWVPKAPRADCNHDGVVKTWMCSAS